MLTKIKHWLVRRLGASPAQRSFAGAAVNRLTLNLSSANTSINTDLDGALSILRARARNLCQNSEYGRRFLNLVSNNVIGPKGPMLQVRRFDRNQAIDKPLNDAVETHWHRWSRRCDVTGRMSLATLLRVVITSVARDGESLVNVVRGRQYPYGFALQVMEADRLDDKLNARLDNGNVIRLGVEMDSGLRPVALHLFAAHPGENSPPGPNQPRIRVPLGDIYHVFVPERAEQVRGYSWLHAVLMRANMLAGFEEAAIVAARVGASKVAAFTLDPNSAPADKALEGLADGKVGNALQMTAEPGEFIDLTNNPGVKLEGWNPEYPHQNYESFVKQCLRGLASGLNVAAHNLSGDMTQVNYSSARIAELNERDMWVALQEWLFDTLLMPIYEDWLSVALLRGEITFLAKGNAVPHHLRADIVLASRFQGRRWDWVDPLKDAQAAQQLISTGLASRTEIAASMGREFEDIADELSQEKVYMDAAGISPAPTPSPAPPPTEDPNNDKGVAVVINQPPARLMPMDEDMLEKQTRALSEKLEEAAGRIEAITEQGKQQQHVTAAALAELISSSRRATETLVALATEIAKPTAPIFDDNGRLIGARKVDTLTH